MKKQWLVPKIAEISVRMTEEQVKSGGSGDALSPSQLNDWHECCCS